jgi:hypothetical protein
MSHVTLKEADTADQQITNIDALEAAAVRCGMELRRGKTRFTNWATDHGRLVGDYPPPQGYTSGDMAKGDCLHAIGIPGGTKQNLSHYEIGVVESKKFPGTYSLMYDFFGGAIDKLAGKGLENLHMMYHAEAARAEAKKQGYHYKEVKLDDGTLQIEMDMTMKLGY